jgi:hypothetical protein
METFACISIEDVKMLAKVGRLGKHLFMSKIILAAAALLLSSTSVHAAPAEMLSTAGPRARPMG